MSVCYNRLWKMLIDLKLTKTELAKMSGVSAPTLYRMGRNENVSTDVLEKLCRALNCGVQDILEFENK